MDLFGPFALGVAAVATVGILWREHIKSDDRLHKMVADLLINIPALSAAVTKQTDTIDDMDGRASTRTAEAVEKLIKELRAGKRLGT